MTWTFSMTDFLSVRKQRSRKLHDPQQSEQIHVSNPIRQRPKMTQSLLESDNTIERLSRDPVAGMKVSLLGSLSVWL